MAKKRGRFEQSKSIMETENICAEREKKSNVSRSERRVINYCGADHSKQCSTEVCRARIRSDLTRHTNNSGKVHRKMEDNVIWTATETREVGMTDKVSGEYSSGQARWRRYRTTGMDTAAEEMWDGNR